MACQGYPGGVSPIYPPDTPPDTPRAPLRYPPDAPQMPPRYFLRVPYGASIPVRSSAHRSPRYKTDYVARQAVSQDRPGKIPSHGCGGAPGGYPGGSQRDPSGTRGWSLADPGGSLEIPWETRPWGTKADPGRSLGPLGVSLGGLDLPYTPQIPLEHPPDTPQMRPSGPCIHPKGPLRVPQGVASLDCEFVGLLVSGTRIGSGPLSPHKIWWFPPPEYVFIKSVARGTILRSIAPPATDLINTVRLL